MNNDVKKAIEDNIDLIEDERFDELYSKLHIGVHIGKFTKTLLDAEVLDVYRLTRLPEYFLAFVDDPSFEIAIPGKVKTVPSNAFEYSNVRSVVLEKGIRTIQANAFNRCKSEEFILPSTIKAIGASAFQFSNIKSIDIPEGVKTINKLSFYDCLELKSVKIPSSIIKISDSAFSHCQDLDITYNGTKADWQSIFNRKAFYKSTFVCHCTDGDINYPQSK